MLPQLASLTNLAPAIARWIIGSGHERLLVSLSNSRATTLRLRLNMTNAQILEMRVASFNEHPGPRVGDYLQLPKLHPKLGDMTRFTHAWDDSIQTGGLGGSYYLGDGYLSYSGSLDTGTLRKFIGNQIGTRLGRVWFFDEDIHRAGRGVNFNIECRVFELLPGADLSRYSELETGYSVCVCDDQQQKRHGYKFTVQHRCMAHVAFKELSELMSWARIQGFTLPQDLSTPSWHQLKLSE